MSSVIGLRTWPEKCLPQFMCVTTPQYLLVATYRGQRHSQTGPPTHHKKISKRQRNRRMKFLSVTYSKMGPIVFTTCMS